MSRDPRIDPRPFDEVKSAKGIHRKVVYITLMDQVIYDPVSKSGKVGEQRVCDLKTWRKWAKDGEVLTIHTDVPSFTETGVESNFHISGQLTLIANNIMDLANFREKRRTGGTAISGTPQVEVAQVLFEMGLAAYFKGHDFKRRVDAEVEKRARK